MDWIIANHETDTDNPNEVFRQSTLTPRRIKMDGPLSPNFKFESGVVKTQGGMGNLLDGEEKAVVRTLLVDESSAEDNEVAAEESGNDDYSFDVFLGPDDDPTLGIINQN